MAYLLIDGHNDLPWAHRERFGGDLSRGDIAKSQPSLHTDLPRLAAGGVNAQFWSVYVPSTMPEPEAVVATLEQIDFVRRMAARYDRLELVTTATDLERAVAGGRLASLLGIEGGHAMAGSLAVLREMHCLGVRYMTLTHDRNTSWADSATDTAMVGGLSDLGRSIVMEMNRLGMIVDLSHVADTTMHDALETTTAPVIFSHSNARAMCDTPRNVPDEILERVPGNGGVVMVTFVPFFVAEGAALWLKESHQIARRRSEEPGNPVSVFDVMRERARTDPPPPATLGDVVRQLEYLREAVGIAHVGLGGDFDGSDFVTAELEDVAAYPHLFDALRARRWSQCELDQLAGRNILRVMHDVEAVARI